MLRNLASSLFLTERDAEFDDNKPKVKGRVVTTLHKAKEVRPLVEKCVTIARRSLAAQEAAGEFATDAERGSDAWKAWRKSDQWQQWSNAIAPAVTARRRAVQLLGDKQAVQVLFADVAPRMADRNGGYTRVVRLATPRLGDAGTSAILEFVGKNDRVKKAKSTKPVFETDRELSDDKDEEVQDEVTSSDDEVDASAEDSSSAESGSEASDGGTNESEKDSG
jgi:large subunit ribosomal protein L17